MFSSGPLGRIDEVHRQNTQHAEEDEYARDHERDLACVGSSRRSGLSRHIRMRRYSNTMGNLENILLDDLRVCVDKGECTAYQYAACPEDTRSGEPPENQEIRRV